MKTKQIKNTNKDILKNNNGITLIALVVTIVVLLILAGVSISLILGDNGIISKAKEAKVKTEQSQEKENETIKRIDHWLDNYDVRKDFKIGDFVNYVYDEADNYTYNDEANNISYNIEQKQNLKWKIIAIDEYNVTIVATTSAQNLDLGSVYDHTTAELIAQFEKLENVLNDSCKKLYSNSELSVNARSIVFSDFTDDSKEILKNIESKFFYATSVAQGSSFCMYQNIYINGEDKPYLETICYDNSYQNQTYGSTRSGDILPVVTLPTSIIGEKENNIWQLL